LSCEEEIEKKFLKKKVFKKKNKKVFKKKNKKVSHDPNKLYI